MTEFAFFDNHSYRRIILPDNDFPTLPQQAPALLQQADEEIHPLASLIYHMTSTDKAMSVTDVYEAYIKYIASWPYDFEGHKILTLKQIADILHGLTEMGLEIEIPKEADYNEIDL